MEERSVEARKVAGSTPAVSTGSVAEWQMHQVVILAGKPERGFESRQTLQPNSFHKGNWGAVKVRMETWLYILWSSVQRTESHSGTTPLCMLPWRNADAPGLGPGILKGVWVQIPPGVQLIREIWQENTPKRFSRRLS